ncbi:uncharacterized protein BDR25DRAFT_374016 [Lindgomyces ingoldianus]|uniref:Uncharacterized protein n=1 Tax=Lindgomyces ingoldianus TaxID=673940 RepID=A0ACB6QLJ1_9PLEO|nr:uncharacterized protein BDR25DRAFT_374016 [Lindgomyces ingoldianus]KAF2467791.1 hypothetical protein BDR25DRAFT_374016 [Lindgomyces ingoldianus]
MDVFNVSNTYAQFMSNQMQVLQNAKGRQGLPPRDRKSREDTSTRFMTTLMLTKGTEKGHMIHSSFIPPAYHPCITPMADLRRIAIRDLQLETHHRGTYLLLRSITPPRRRTGIMAIMKDENRDAVMLQLFQQEDEDTRKAIEIVDVGTILLVKEPYFKVMADGEYGLRVDHLSDVIHVNRDDARIPGPWQPRLVEIEHSAESLKTKGNIALVEGRYWDAITEYTIALRQPATPNEIDIIKRNRSLAFLKVKRFDSALLDTGFPTFNPNVPEKALFRAAEALYCLERFGESCEVLELLRKNYPHNARAVEVLDRARARYLEQKTGSYDFKLLQAKAKKLRPPHLDHATYIGPVEVRQTESKGRGLFVTRAVKAGELLLCEKAFSYSYADEREGGRSKITLLLNPETKHASLGAEADLIKLIVHKLHRNPSVAPPFTTLYHGTYEKASTHTVDAEPIVLVDRIISFNVFGCPVSSLVFHKDTMANQTKEEPSHYSCGIWTKASYINHSCTSNAHRSFIGDMMIVRACCDLEPGTEITFLYTSLGDKNAQKKLSHWGIVCDCAICLNAKTTKAAVVTERRKLLEQMKQEFNIAANGVFQAKKIERLLDALDTTYARPADGLPRLLLWDPQLAMIRTLEFVGKALTSLGFIVVGVDLSPTAFAVVKWGLVVDYLVEIFMHACTAFAAKGAMKHSKQAEEYAKVAYKIIVGEDTSFSESYGK